MSKSAPTLPPKTAPVLVDIRGLRDRFGLDLSRTTIYRLVDAGILPQPLKLSPARSAKLFWRTADIEAAIAAQEAARKDERNRRPQNFDASSMGTAA